MSESEDKLLKVVKEKLTENGHLNKIKAELRMAIMSILKNSAKNKKPPKLSKETIIINELVREYLQWNGYMYTEQVLITESGQTKERMDREVIATKLGVVDDETTLQIPLLYFILGNFPKKS